MRRRAASICRCFLASFSTLRSHQCAAVSLRTAHAFKFHFRCEDFGRLHLDAEFGPRASTVGRSEWLSGIVCGFDVAKQTMLMAELHDESRMNFSRDVLTLNFGLRHEFTENYILIVSMGHELRSADQPTALIGYFGMQFVY